MLSVSYLHRLSAADRMAVHHAVNVSIRLTDHQTGREVDLPLTESVSEVNSLRDAGRRIRDVAANMGGVSAVFTCFGRTEQASAERLQREEHRLIYEPNVSTGPAPNSLREQEHVQANERAVELLESNLSEEQSREMSKTGKFTVTASSGQRYLIDAKGGDYNVTSIDGAGVKLIDCCLDVGGDVPVADKVLVQKLLLEADEGRFLNIANTKCHYAPMAPPTMASDNLNWDTLRRPVAPRLDPRERELTELVQERTGRRDLGVRLRDRESSRCTVALIDLNNGDAILSYRVVFDVFDIGPIAVGNPDVPWAGEFLRAPRILREAIERLIAEWERRQAQQRPIHRDTVLTAVAQSVFSYCRPAQNWTGYEIQRFRQDRQHGDLIRLVDSEGGICGEGFVGDYHDETFQMRAEITKQVCKEFIVRIERNLAVSEPGITWANYRESEAVGDLRRLHDEMLESIGVDDD